MPSHRRAFVSACRAALLWTLAFYIGIQSALLVITNRWLPALRDPEYGYKLALLRRRLEEEPQRELILILGSSRSGYGFRPEVVPAWESSSHNSPLVFNFGLTGAGPVLELLCLHRLLAAGIHPARLVIEVLPPILHQEGAWAELAWLNLNRLSWDDVRLVRAYAEQPRDFCFAWFRAYAAPCFAQRFCIMSRFAPGWLPWETRQDIWRGLDRTGWMVYPHTIMDAAGRRRALEFAHRQYIGTLTHFHITPVADHALRALLALCRRERIGATLVLMPEGTVFQSWYPPAARAEIDNYLASVSRECRVALIDARSWLPDSAFFDSHHLHPDGATAFTERFARAVLQPASSLRTTKKSLERQ